MAETRAVRNKIALVRAELAVGPENFARIRWLMSRARRGTTPAKLARWMETDQDTALGYLEALRTAGVVILDHGRYRPGTRTELGK